MKKLIVLLSVLLLTFVLSPTNSANANPCHPRPTNEEPTEIEMSESEDVLLEEDGQAFNGDMVTPDCGGGGYPTGWVPVRNAATYSHSNSSGTKIYRQSGGYPRANTDFFKMLGDVVPYPKSDGSITYVKRTNVGDVRLYKSSSGQEPTLWFKNEKIRYY